MDFGGHIIETLLREIIKKKKPGRKSIQMMHLIMQHKECSQAEEQF